MLRISLIASFSGVAKTKLGQLYEMSALLYRADHGVGDALLRVSWFCHRHHSLASSGVTLAGSGEATQPYAFLSMMRCEKAGCRQFLDLLGRETARIHERAL